MDRRTGWWPQNETGVKIAEYLDKLRGEQTMKGFCTEYGIDPVAISQYRSGKSPRWQTIAYIANRLGMTFAQFMVEALGAPPDEFAAKSIELAYAIESDPSLTDVQRAMLHDLINTDTFRHLGAVG